MKAETISKQDDVSPRVLRISERDEFQQCVAVARLAAKLCQIEMARSKAPLEKQNADPEQFLSKAWELITSARGYVLRPQTDVEFLVQNNGVQDLAKVLGRRDRASCIPFEKLCDPKRNKGDTETILGVSWKVYGSKEGFDDLFWKYWQDIGENWKRRDQNIGTMKIRNDLTGNVQKWDFYAKPMRNGVPQRKKIAALWRKRPKQVAARWKKRGQQLLSLWKKDGLPPKDFLALAEFRRAHDKRAANLKRAKRRRTVKHRMRQRNGRTAGQEQLARAAEE